jgi:alpha-L-fucosidase
MRERNWFYSDQDEDTINSLDELLGLYRDSLGRGCDLVTAWWTVCVGW